MQGQTSIAPLTAAEAIAAAEAIEALGWKPTPLWGIGPDGTCQCAKGKNCGRSAGKHNFAQGWQNDTRGAEIFREYADGAVPRPNGTGFFPKKTRMNVGILTGAPSGIFVFDVDEKNGGFDSMKRIVAERGKMPTTRIVQTGSGGFHYYFQMPDFDLTNRAKELQKIYPGIDIRGTGGQVVSPPSVSGIGPYSLRVDAPVAPAPAWLLEILRPQPEVIGTIGGVTVVSDPSLPQPKPGDPVFIAPVTDDEWASMGPATTAAPAQQHAQTPREAKYEASIVNGELKRIADLTRLGWDAQWDNTTFEVACQMVELANAPWTTLTIDEAHDAFMEHCPKPEPGYDPEAKWLSALQRVGGKARPAPGPSNEELLFGGPSGGDAQGPTQGGAARNADAADLYSLTDLGNAHRLVNFAQGRIRWAIDAQRWLTYDGRRWDDEGSDTLLKHESIHALEFARLNELPRASQVPDEFYANDEPKSSPYDRLSGWLVKSEMEARIKAMASMAEADRRVRARMEDFDTDPMLFNAANGAIDLSNGQLHPHGPDQMFRHISETPYDPEAKCPMWEKFLDRVQPDFEMREYLQQVLGYSMTGRMDEQVIFIHNGQGATGKTTFLEVVMGVLGEYGQKLDRDTLMSKSGQGSSIPADVARMAGARFLAASETAAGKKIDDERVKELVGGDTQTARHLYGKWFDFRPTGKIHMATNHLPSFESGGDGIGRRLRLVPWEVQIPEAERDKTLRERILATEAPGVLAWLVRGAISWASSGGLVTPESVRLRSGEHIEEADPVWPFIREKLTLGEEFATEFQAIYGAYESWCQSNGNKPMSGRALSMALRERLGVDSKFLAVGSRRSMFRVKVNLEAVPAHHDAFFSGQRA